MNARYACGTAAHQLARRNFLGVLGGGMASLAAAPSLFAGLKQQRRRMLVVFLSGGVSQLESWDPKPRTDTGGPFQSIPTAVPGMHISELLPKTAQHMDKLSLIRGINTNNGDHGKGKYQMTYGRNQMPGVDHPHLGAVCARSLERSDNPLPGHIHIPAGGRGNNAAYLGPRYASTGVNGKPPANSQRVSSLTTQNGRAA